MATPAPKALCGAKASSTGKPCTRPAGWGTGHPGDGRCKLHGGANPRAELGGAIRLARREAAAMGRPLDIDPHDAILQCIAIAAGEVAYASEAITQLEDNETVGPVVTTHTRPLKEEKGAEDPSHEVTERHHGPPALHIWITVRHQAMDRLVHYSKVAIAAGIEERRVRLAERQAELLARAIRGVLHDLGVQDRPEVARVVRRHLELVAA